MCFAYWKEKLGWKVLSVSGDAVTGKRERERKMMIAAKGQGSTKIYRHFESQSSDR